MTALDDSALNHVVLKGESKDKELVKVQAQLRDGRIVSHWFWVSRLPPQTLVPSILWFFLKLGLFVVGALVLWQRPDDRSALQFFLLCIVTFGAYIGGDHWSRILTQPLLLLAFTLCSLLLPPISLHFYLLFPRPKQFLQRNPVTTLLAIYGPALVFLLILGVIYTYIRLLAPTDEDVNQAVKLSRGVVYAYFIVAAIWYLASIVCLVHSYRVTIETTERNQVKWILFGALASLFPIGYTLYLAFLRRDDFGSGEGTWPMFVASVCVTGAFTISITRYRLMQLDQIISSGMIFFLLSSLAGLVYWAVVFAAALFSSQWITGPSLSQALAVSSAVLVILLVLDLIRGRVRRALDRRFYREKYQLDRTLQRMSQAVEQLVDAPTLAPAVAGVGGIVWRIPGSDLPAGR